MTETINFVAENFVFFKMSDDNEHSASEFHYPDKSVPRDD